MFNFQDGNWNKFKKKLNFILGKKKKKKTDAKYKRLKDISPRYYEGGKLIKCPVNIGVNAMNCT